MRVLIIGGTGLISTPITRCLLDRGDQLTLYNRALTEARLDNSANRIIGDRKDYSAFEKQVQNAGPFDCVIDMVCYVPEDAESVVRAFSHRIEQIIFCSTAIVYGMPATRYPITEDEPRLSKDPYPLNKARCEDILLEAQQRAAFSVTIIRPFDAYGEGGSLAETFGRRTVYIDRVRKGKPIIVQGDGKSFHVACHVDDVARAFVGAVGNTRASGKAYHLGGEEWMPWNIYHERVADALGVACPRLVHIPTDLLLKAAPRQASRCDRFNFVFDNSAARADLGFQYTIPFVEGARRTIGWLDEHDRIENSDAEPFDDRLISFWDRLGSRMIQELAGLGI